MVHLELSAESVTDLLNELFERLDNTAAELKGSETARVRSEVQGIYNLIIATSHPQAEQHEYNAIIDQVQAADSRLSEMLTRQQAGNRA